MELSRHVVETAMEWQRKIHSHPELGYKETETSEKIGDYLRAFGWDVTSRLAGTGVLAVKKGNGEIPRLLLRAELDALPIQEETGLPYASNTPGVSHACGHDGHLATLLGVAAGLAEADFRHGDVGLVFQPGEELLGGGRELVEREKLFSLFDADLCLALHGMPFLASGSFGLIAGPAMAAIDTCRIKVIGRPGHGAAPHEAIDPIVIAAEIVTSLQTIISRERNPMEPAVLSFGRINGGTADNSIAAEVVLDGTMRYFQPAIGASMAAAIGRRAEGVAAAHGARAEVSVHTGYPPLVNDSDAVEWLRELIITHWGSERLSVICPMMISEDFSYYLQNRPGVMIFIGTGGEYPLHHPGYIFPPEVLAAGIDLFLSVIRQLPSAPSFRRR